MGRYNHCPNCGNTDEGDDILRCEECNRIHCDKCSQETLGIGTGCPDCGGTRETLGTIEPDSEQGDSNEEFTECPNCSNTEPGTAILECDVCGLKHCDECSESVGFLGLGAKCPTPNCAGTRDTIGHIAEAKESESENSDEE